MANLIPPDAKRDIIAEYWVRVLTVWLILLGCAFLVIAILNIPTYVLVYSQLNAFQEETNEAHVRQQAFRDAQNTIADTNNLSRLLITYDESVTFSDIQQALDTLAGNTVAINELRFSHADTGPSVAVTGVASTRIALANFSNEVEQHPLFGKAVVPISNLAKDKDIPFTITVAIEKETP